MDKAKDRAVMPKGTASILENRSLENDYSTIVPILKEGIKVLDVGCGTGAITKGIADLVGQEGQVVGIDTSEDLINIGKDMNEQIKNLKLYCANIFEFDPESKFDLIVSARVLQWLENPKDALNKIKGLLKPNGIVSILDYNHTKLEWYPSPPESMQKFYIAFLNWRSDAGMNNQLAMDLPSYFKDLGFTSIETINANECYKKQDLNFISRIGIWKTVAETRGKQLVKDGYIDEQERLETIEEYSSWIESEAQEMTMNLSETRGTISR